MASSRGAEPPPQLVRGNDWRQLALPPPSEFRPELPVSVIVPWRAQPEVLARTLAALEGQTCPHELFEVIVVDGGSPEPLTAGASLIARAPFAVRVVRPEDPGFGLARARNAGARAAAHEILLFLDAGLLPEADWLLAHTRWHHAVPDALTLGSRAPVSADELAAEAIRKRPGSIGELLAGRRVDRAGQDWWESHLRRTDELTSKEDDPFRAVVGSNLGVRRGFFELVGGFDESFTEYGGEDTEFGYRAFTRGGLFVPVREGLAWRQGPRYHGQAANRRTIELARANLAQRIAHPGFRSGIAGRTFAVPRFVVTIRGGAQPADDLLGTVVQVLSQVVYDLVVRLELPGDHPGREWLGSHLGSDPRVRVGPSRPALEEFPASPFFVTLPVTRLPGNVVGTLRRDLGWAVLAQRVLSDGSRAEIVQAWALHRALRTPLEASDFGEVVTVPFGEPRAEGGESSVAPAPKESSLSGGGLRAAPRRVDERQVVPRFVRRIGLARLRRRFRRLRPAPAAPRAGSRYPLGVEIVALGPRAAGVFGASLRVARSLVGQPAEVVLADTAADTAGVEAPVVVLDQAPPRLSVPAFDPWVDNPVGCAGIEREGVGSLGQPARLPAGSEADREVRADDRPALRRLRWLEDVAAFHPDPAARAGELARLAASGVVVHLADGDPELEPYLGAELFALMTSEVRELDDAGREELSVRMRRAALREHSLGSRARQVAERVLPDPPWLPLVSVLVATRRPGLLPRVLATVREQNYPRLELILALHGEGFGEVARGAAGPSVPLTVLRLAAALPLGSVLNAAARSASGTLLTKLDDDDVYGPDHLWDLVLAHDYSRASVVGKAAEFVYLGASDRTIRRSMGAGERFGSKKLSGAATLVTRSLLDRLGGWKRCAVGEDRFLCQAAARIGARVYATHSYGCLVVRHGLRHSWDSDEAFFRQNLLAEKSGWQPELAGIPGASPLFEALPLRDDGAGDFRAFARKVHERVWVRLHENGGGKGPVLADLAAHEAEGAKTAPLRQVAHDLAEALRTSDLERALRITVTAKRRPDLGAEKIISHRYRYVWLCVPKVASRSIRDTLRELDPEAEVFQQQSIAEVFRKCPDARGYFSFAFVRDPGYRAFSFYAEKYLESDDQKRRHFVDPYYGTSPDIRFDDLCSWLNTPYGSDLFADRHWLSQTPQVVLEDGRPADFVGLHERLDADFRTVCARLGLPPVKLPRRNTMVGWAPTEEEFARVARWPEEHLTEQNRALLRQRYAEDFALLDRLRRAG